MAEIINLNKRRKQKARQEKEKLAAANRIRFGRTLAEKQREAAEIDQAAHKLDQLRRERDDTDKP